MGTTKRTYYYWKSDRIVPRVARRSSGFGRWPVRDASEDSELVGYVEEPGEPMLVGTGPAGTPDRVAEMVRVHRGVFSNTSKDIGAEIPDQLLRQVANTVSAAASAVSARHRKYANEDRASGDFFGRLEGVTTGGGWTLEISAQGFSTHVKEPTLGADEGIIIDVQNAEGERVVKALWLQAKLADKMPDHILGLPDLAHQMEAMSSRTREAYAVVYTPEGVFVRRSGEDASIEPSTLIVDALRCHRGDREGKVVAETLDRNLVLELLVSQAR